MQTESDINSNDMKSSDSDFDFTDNIRGNEMRDTDTTSNTHTHNRFTAGLEYVWVHPGQQVPER